MILLRLSLDVRRPRLAVSNPTFAFPYGCRSFAAADGAAAATERQVELRRQAAELKRSGVRCALTSESKLVTPESDAYDWGRFEAGQADTVETLVAKLNGWYSLTRAAWRRCRRPFAGGDSN